MFACRPALMLWPAMEKAASCGVRRPVQNRPACGVQVATTTFQLKLYSLLEPNNLVRASTPARFCASGLSARVE